MATLPTLSKDAEIPEIATAMIGQIENEDDQDMFIKLTRKMISSGQELKPQKTDAQGFLDMWPVPVDLADHWFDVLELMRSTDSENGRGDELKNAVETRLIMAEQVLIKGTSISKAAVCAGKAKDPSNASKIFNHPLIKTIKEEIQKDEPSSLVELQASYTIKLISEGMTVWLGVVRSENIMQWKRVLKICSLIRKKTANLEDAKATQN